MLLPYGEYFNDYVNMDLGVFEGVEFNEMVNKGRRVCRFCAGGVGLWKSDMPGSLAIGLEIERGVYVRRGYRLLRLR